MYRRKVVMTSKECVEVVVAQFHTESEDLSRKAERKNFQGR